ncbi:MAG: hypothetical protein LUC93_01825 [Planctomycetaceae bacterium]|nr:hypothetical protein [Planctomycetaceae bacterium]
MKRIGLAMVAIFALVGGIAFAEDMDVRALQAKLAAQEARLNDLQAKMYGAACDESVVADGITSLRKNAVVTLGGTVNTRYFARSGNIKSSVVGTGAPAYTDAAGDPVAADLIGRNPDGRVKVADYKFGDMRISDAKLEVKIDVNENFDAYLKMDLQDTDKTEVSGIAQNYWIRWKNVCNTGFGVLVGRDALKFGGVTPYGAIGSFTKNNDGFNDVIGIGGLGELGGVSGFDVNDYNGVGPGPENFTGGDAWGEGMFVGGGIMPTHTTWDHSRTTQITPYWETQDGSFSAELSLIQAIDTRNALYGARADESGSYTKYRSINYGLGSGTLRLTWKPIEGLKVVGSVMNLYAKNGGGRWNWRSGRLHNESAPALINDAGEWEGFAETSNSNTAVNLAFEYRPCFFNRLNLWASYTHGWNEGWIKDQDSDVLSYGFGFDITEQLTFFAQGDYMRVKNDQGNVWHKATGYAGYAGLIYTLPYGVNLEAGYRHEQISYKDRAGNKHTKAKADTIYAHLGFNF